MGQAPERLDRAKEPPKSRMRPGKDHGSPYRYCSSFFRKRSLDAPGLSQSFLSPLHKYAKLQNSSLVKVAQRFPQVDAMHHAVVLNHMTVACTAKLSRRCAKRIATAAQIVLASQLTLLTTRLHDYTCRNTFSKRHCFDSCISTL